jgi:hypothetical protein
MAFVHGKDTYVSVDGDDLSAFTNTSEFERGADEHDVTTYGAEDHAFSGGLGTGAFTMGGIYDNGASGPRDILEPLVGTTITVIRRPEGTGSGLPQDSFTGLLTKYVETSPVADMVTWSADFRVSGAVTSTNQ